MKEVNQVLQRKIVTLCKKREMFI